MLINYLQKNKLSRKILYKILKRRASEMISRFEPFLSKNDLILDLGAGSCNVSEILLEKGYKVTPIDIQNISFVDNLTPDIYDGEKIEYEDNKFNKALILTVLHHTPNPEKLLIEAKRVSKEIIIIEDIYSNWLHKYLTYFFDSLINLEFFRHPHTNKSDVEWKETFNRLGLELAYTRYDNSFVIFRHATYYLKAVPISQQI